MAAARAVIANVGEGLTAERRSASLIVIGIGVPEIANKRGLHCIARLDHGKCLKNTILSAHENLAFMARTFLRIAAVETLAEE
jgi:hypothetical protein